MTVQHTRRTIDLYAFCNYLASLLLLWPYVRTLSVRNGGEAAFIAAAYLSYAALYVLPIWGVGRLCLLFFRRMSRAHAAILGFAAVLMGLLSVLLFVDGRVYVLYGFHINGFVWNLLSTSGGLDSMGISESAIYAACGMAAAIVLLQFALLRLCIYAVAKGWAVQWPSRRMWRTGLACVLMLAVGERIAYGFSHMHAYGPIVLSAKIFPLYQPLTFRGLATAMGHDIPKQKSPQFQSLAGPLGYPAVPLRVETPAKPLNIIWLTAESWRWDMLDPQIMPSTWAFAQEAQHYTRHYSGGNGTRMALFSMFFGLYGNYWFPMLAQQRGPVLLDVLQQQGYQMNMYTSASFSYPEFDKTIFAQIPPHLLHQDKTGPRWERDRSNVGDMLHDLDRRDRSKPFMSFMFFESPHARYEFPPETAIRKPYLEDFNYASMDLKRDIGLIKNRYINSCAHLDTQFARIFEYLEHEKLLDSTIVVLTGDHGEEFMEKGRWGHNSDFVEEQVRTPFVIRVPGRTPQRIDRLTSHLDIPATLMPFLGVKNPAADYSLGTSMIDGPPRRFAVMASWDEMTFRDEQYKASFPFKGGSLINITLRDGSDAPLPDIKAFFSQRQQEIAELMHDSVRFQRPALTAQGAVGAIPN